jgi:hypothetical protein
MRRCAADRDRPRTATRGGTRRPRARYPRCARAARSAPAPAPAPPPSAHSSPARSQTHRPAPHALPRHTQPPYRRHPEPRFRQPHTRRRPAGNAERFRVVGIFVQVCAAVPRVVSDVERPFCSLGLLVTCALTATPHPHVSHRLTTGTRHAARLRASAPPPHPIAAAGKGRERTGRGWVGE